jgi:hypothetical protein
MQSLWRWNILEPRTKEIPPFTVTTREQLFELKEKLLSDSTDPATATRTSKQSFVAEVVSRL